MLDRLKLYITNTLDRFIGPQRTLTFHMLVEKWAVIVWGGIPLLIGVFYLIQYASRGHEHIAYEVGEVLFASEYATESGGFRASFVVKTADGQEIMLKTKRLALSATVVETVCMEKRRYVDNGKMKYLLVPPARCEGL